MPKCKYIKDEPCFFEYDKPVLEECKFCWDIRGKHITIYGPVVRSANEAMRENEKLKQEIEALKR